MAQAPRLLVIGSANADLVTRVPRCPRPGESLIGRSFATVPGGKGANQAVAAARLGAETVFAGCVGRDALGDLLEASLGQAGCRLHLKRHASEPTGTAVILVADDGQNTIVVTPAANFGLTPSDIAALESEFRAADAVLLQLEIPRETVEAALDVAARLDVFTVLDAGPAQPVPAGVLRKACLVSPNETEAEALTGIAVTGPDRAAEAARQLLGMGVREAVIKLGAQGAYCSGEPPLHVAAFPVNAIDSVAAGDAFTAALAMAWNAMPRREALRFANAAGALATTRPGAQDAMPTRAEVDAFLDEHKE